MKKIINSEMAPAAIGPYSHAVLAGGFLYISGQVPVNPENGSVPEGVAEQAAQVMENLKAILTEAGLNFENAVKATIFLTNLDDFQVVNDVYASYLAEGSYPARECVQVSRLPRGVDVEISMIAYKG
ncbi:2-iminobutanoate/2-iminopropanoate deaminase [Cruoricaptor ignavus]|uniref:2-iminobutanoate/2-iminopropanoate deaminase n=1 Tax=Cruoricaptor ignavus TaxID=1118202 RepID=A0A1M6AJX0_9FLAO|nr:RidA family protein [Cruoricaptor ignavus]SHI36804.1 2-iminobutanoate/2-iminopropanoate deaminase [Cruoricaptor ignavus]